MFLIIKVYPNRELEDSLEAICVVKNGGELDKKISEIGESDLDIYDFNYYEVKNINLKTMEII